EVLPPRARPAIAGWRDSRAAVPRRPDARAARARTDLDGVTRPHEVIPPRCYAAVGMPRWARNATKSAPSSVQARTVPGERLAASRWRRQDGRSTLSSATLAARAGVWSRC